MKLIVGLGNPGKSYENTRHNVGFGFIDFFFKKLARDLKLTNSNSIDWKFDKIFNSEILSINGSIGLRPQTFMNNSGIVVKKYMEKNNIKPENLILIYDDLDIKFGSYKICNAKSPKKHNGVNSVINQIGTSEFIHIRIGVENRQGDAKNIPGMDYVLMKFTKDETYILDETFEKISKELSNFIS